MARKAVAILWYHHKLDYHTSLAKHLSTRKNNFKHATTSLKVVAGAYCKAKSPHCQKCQLYAQEKLTTSTHLRPAGLPYVANPLIPLTLAIACCTWNTGKSRSQLPGTLEVPTLFPAMTLHQWLHSLSHDSGSAICHTQTFATLLLAIPVSNSKT